MCVYSEDLRARAIHPATYSSRCQDTMSMPSSRLLSMSGARCDSARRRCRSIRASVRSRSSRRRRTSYRSTTSITPLPNTLWGLSARAGAVWEPLEAMSAIGISSVWAAPPLCKRFFGAIHTEAYAFNSFDGRVDFYVRAALTLPSAVFTHYKLPVGQPAEFWKAPHYDFVGQVDKPDWAAIPMARL